MNSKLIYILLIILVINACSSDYDFEEGTFPETPVNFESINSEYDDYNSTVPYELYNEIPYLFSSNRGSNGEQFDIISLIVQFYYNPDQDQAYFNAIENTYSFYDVIVDKINTSSNEFGPFITYTLDYLYDLLFYATDSSGNLDIYYTYNKVYDNIWVDAKPLAKINTEYNEAYPTINKTRDELYFCSDENQTYDIYKVALPASTSIINWFNTEELPEKINCENLNSSFDDKCPYINRNLMVFASNREGGYGGYDLYYSKLIDGEWSEPVNFGASINTEYDEYRPVALYTHNYTNDLMFFSSNRPGGKGGFDLYYVGIPKMILK